MMGIVDLGLSVKWSFRNLNEEDIGTYGKYHYTWGDILFDEQYGNSLTMGVSNDELQEMNILDKDRLALEYDIAHICLGEGWRLPTHNEVLELLNNTSVEKTLWGLKFISKINDEWIVLPFAGYKYNGQYFCNGSSGWYWTSTPCNHNKFGSHSLIIASNGYCTVDWSCRSLGFSIRPVYNK